MDCASGSRVFVPTWPLRFPLKFGVRIWRMRKLYYRTLKFLLTLKSYFVKYKLNRKPSVKHSTTAVWDQEIWNLLPFQNQNWPDLFVIRTGASFPTPSSRSKCTFNARFAVKTFLHREDFLPDHWKWKTGQRKVAFHWPAIQNPTA